VAVAQLAATPARKDQAKMVVVMGAKMNLLTMVTPIQVAAVEP
jgi:hypothetical protein